jgi:hypothetical protein
MDVLQQYPELSSYLDDSDDYETTASEFAADDQRWLLVTQRGPQDGGQLLFRITRAGLKPVAADTAVNLNPSTRGFEVERAPFPVYAVSSDADHTAVAVKMEEAVGTFSTSAGPDHGNLACVWAVRHLVRDVLDRWITRTDTTSDFASELKGGFKRSFAEADIPAGGIIISPTKWLSGTAPVRHGHVGLLGQRGQGDERPIYSNSSSQERWMQNFTLGHWHDHYGSKGLDVLFFPLPTPEVSARRSPAEAEFQAEALARLTMPHPADDDSQPDPLAGEGIPQRGLVLEGEFTRADTGLPISRLNALKVARFMKDNFGPAMRQAVAGTPFSVDLLCGIACQETAIYWVGLIGTSPVDKILERCVYDASGDYPGTNRSVFPVNTAAFRGRYGDDFTSMLIEEANQTRALRGYGPKPWVYKGYGIFQYDLQYVSSNEAFFRERQWYRFDACLQKAVGELKKKYAVAGDLWHAVRAYNGSGARATTYANNVMQFTEWCATVA